jgi:hypothetical protein
MDAAWSVKAGAAPKVRAIALNRVGCSGSLSVGKKFCLDEAGTILITDFIGKKFKNLTTKKHPI